MLIEIHLMEQLLAFAECGSLLKAAEKLHMSQPALTRSMKKLEDDLGVSLFLREKKRISLNETGKLAVTLAEQLVRQNEDMTDRIRAFDKSRNSIVFASCAPFPIIRIVPLMTNHFGNMRISSEIATDEAILAGLANHSYQLAALRANPGQDQYFCQRYITEQLYLTVPATHRFVKKKKKSLKFSDLKGEKILLNGRIGFWMDICEKHMPDTELLIQSEMSALESLIRATEIPFFNTDRMSELGYLPPDRVNLPIEEKEAHVTFYIACLSSEKNKYTSFMNAIRSEIITGRS